MNNLRQTEGFLMIQFKNNEYQCMMELTLALIGGKWKSLILWHLGSRTLRFSELNKVLPRITQKMLTQQLRELEADSLIQRVVYPQIPPRVEYSLTAAGKSIIPVLRSMCDWGAQYYQSVQKENPKKTGTKESGRNLEINP
jgi:DNA-binding HxlR family transcriptional regulator